MSSTETPSSTKQISPKTNKEINSKSLREQMLIECKSMARYTMA